MAEQCSKNEVEVFILNIVHSTPFSKTAHLELELVINSAQFFISVSSNTWQKPDEELDSIF